MKIYAVGGAVRDELLGLPVADRDYVVVGSTPEEMVRLGYKPVGKDFPVFLHPRTHDEHALARTERKVARGYKGFQIHAAPEVTLEQYVSRMKSDSAAIYYLTADTLAAARNSPHLEGFRASGLEVLLLIDRIDEWVAGHLHEFEGKTLANVASSAADVASAIETPEKAAAESAFKHATERLGKILSGKIASAQVSARLTDSPAVLVAGRRVSIKIEGSGKTTWTDGELAALVRDFRP